MNMYNVGADFAVIGRVMSGTSVEGYIIISKTDASKALASAKKMFIPKREFEILALNKKIYNCSAQSYNGETNLKGIKCKLSKLPRYTKECMEIIEPKENKHVTNYTILLKYKVRDGREVVGYIVQERLPNGSVVTRYKTRNDIMKAAANNKIYGVKCQSNAGRTIIRGVNGFSLNAIPEVTKEELKKHEALALI